jgi:hypothetical protein
MDALGRVSWLQLENRDGLRAAAELAEIEGVDAASLKEIRAGRMLANLELRQAFGRTGPVVLNEATPLGEDENLLAALFEVDAAHAPDPANSYQNWLARQEKRAVQG